MCVIMTEERSDMMMMMMLVPTHIFRNKRIISLANVSLL